MKIVAESLSPHEVTVRVFFMDAPHKHALVNRGRWRACERRVGRVRRP